MAKTCGLVHTQQHVGDGTDRVGHGQASTLPVHAPPDSFMATGPAVEHHCPVPGWWVAQFMTSGIEQQKHYLLYSFRSSANFDTVGDALQPWIC